MLKRKHIVVDSKQNKCWIVPPEATNWYEKLPGIWQDVQAYTIDGEVLGIPYNEELINVNGCGFVLFCYTPEHDKNLQMAIEKLRRDQDVVKIRVVKSVFSGMLFDNFSGMLFDNAQST